MLFDGTKALVLQPQNRGNIIWVVAANNNWAEIVVPLLDFNRSSALLRSQKEFSRKIGKYGVSDGANLLTANGIQHIFIPATPIDDITTNIAWLYTAVASYMLIPAYSAYDFIYDIPAGIENSKITVGQIQQMLNKIQRSATADGTIEFSRSVTALTDYLGYTSTSQHIEKLWQTVIDTKYAVALNPEKPIHSTLTLHSSKGLEFDQVILFIEDYAFSGNVSNDHINNHYVACTRAKSKLIIVDTESQDACAARRKVLEKIRSAGIGLKTLISL
ncbi:MAG: ATP-binding domain-containing protein [Peptococcaceae bacterium]